MKITVIIPVYQVETTLRRCVDSIIAQSFADWEAILVDDGSTDGSAAICDSYPATDRRIKTIHQENCGLGAARNRGIEEATGDYIMFVDSDDALSGETMEKLAEEIRSHGDCDFIEFPIFLKYGNAKEQSIRTFPQNTYTDRWNYWFNGKAYLHSYACNKVFKREVFERVRFTENRKFEDLFTLPKIMDACKKIATTNVGLYYYYDNNSGITATAGADIKDLLDAHLLVIDGELNWKCPEHIARKAFNQYYAHLVNIQLLVCERCGIHMPHVPTLPVAVSPKTALLNIVGMKNLCKLNNLYHKLCNNH